jgi:hypothetical protein
MQLRQSLLRNRLRIALVTALVTAVAAATVYQGRVEAVAAAQWQEADSSLASELAHANQIGLTRDELAPFVQAQRAISGSVPPVALLFFNSQRIGFFQQNRQASSLRAAELRALEAAITGRTRDQAAVAVKELAEQFARGRALGVDSEDLAPFEPLVSETQGALDKAALPKEYRLLKAHAQEMTTKLAPLVQAQESDNARVAALTAEAAAQNHGDVALARQNAQEALAQARFDLQTADLLKIALGRLPRYVEQGADRLPGAQSLAEVEGLTGLLRFRDAQVAAVLEASAPAKAITISLTEQRLRAFERGKLVWWSWVTTGRPGLETSIGTWSVLRKNTPWTMQSPWPKELPDGRPDPRWYPDSKVQQVMWFTDSGEGMHDAPWRSVYGPGTNFSHADIDPGAPTGTHGCVNLATGRMPWLWNWTPLGTPVIVY